MKSQIDRKPDRYKDMQIEIYIEGSIKRQIDSNKYRKKYGKIDR